MTNRYRIRVFAAAFGAAVSAALAGCGDEAPACSKDHEVWGACAGVPPAEVCGSDTCTEGVGCKKVVEVDGDGALQSAIEGASSGTCIALAPGSYGVAKLPGGVSLLGRSADVVKVQHVALAEGEGAVVRGIGVGAQGIVLRGATGARIESVRVTGSADTTNNGVSLEPGSSAEIVTSEIEKSGRAGVLALDADVTLDRVIVSGAQATGVWIEGSQCDAACVCASRPTLTMKNSALRNNHVLGLSIRGAAADLRKIDVTGTSAGESFFSGQFGGGVSASHCSATTAAQARILDSADWGILVDGATAALGEEDADQTVEVRKNRRGLWIQNVCTGGGSPCVTLHNGTFEENVGVGVGVAGGSRGIILCRTLVTGTSNATLPVFDVNGSVAQKDVGDGVSWLDQSDVTLMESTLRDNERQSLLIDGPATGTITGLTLEGSDQDHAPLQQNLMPGGAQPTVDMTATLLTNVARQLAVPQPVDMPPSITGP